MLTWEEVQCCVGARILESDEHEFTRVIVPNNDARAEINKHRAQAFAAKRGLQLLWNFAQDQIPLELLATDPHLAQRKVEFLQRHDRECGDLPGLVPLALGMPMLLSDHIDRPKLLLRGCLCHVVGWKVSQDETALPSKDAEVPELTPDETQTR